MSASGEWSDVVLLIREVFEIASQIVQAYFSSFLISSVWINQVLAGLIFLNTIASTLVHYHIEEQVGLRRLYSTVIDLALDFAWGFIIPGKIIFVYISLFIANHGSFPEDFNYSDTLQIKATLECNQFFMVSWVDVITKTLPYLNMLLGLQSIKFLIQHDKEAARLLSSTKIQPVGPSMPFTKSRKRIVPGAAHSTAATISNVSSCKDYKQVEIKLSTYGKRITASVVIIMPLFGIFVLFTSITSSGIIFGQGGACAAGCKLQMHPWFTRQCACSVMEINCYERGITGRESEIHGILQSLDPRVLNSLIISRCPQLVVTTDIRHFSNLILFELYNSTLVDWPSTASLSLPYVPNLSTIYIVRSRLAVGIPEGLTVDLSPNVMDIEFVATDLGGPLPDDLDKKWPAVLMLYFEHCELLEFPAAIAKMTLTDLSLVDNNISEIPESLSDSSMYVMLDHSSTSLPVSSP